MQSIDLISSYKNISLRYEKVVAKKTQINQTYLDKIFQI